MACNLSSNPFRGIMLKVFKRLQQRHQSVIGQLRFFQQTPAAAFGSTVTTRKYNNSPIQHQTPAEHRQQTEQEEATATSNRPWKELTEAEKEEALRRFKATDETRQQQLRSAARYSWYFFIGAAFLGLIGSYFFRSTTRRPPEVKE